MENRLFVSDSNKPVAIFVATFFLLSLFMIADHVNSAGGQPGDHCQTSNDCRADLRCLYNTCLAQPFAPCNSWADCAGSKTNLMGCFDGKCLGRHAYPCGDRRDDPVCAPGFHCDISNPGYHYCEGDEEDVNVDLKANNSDGPITLNFRDYLTLSWTSQNATSCQASGDWSGSKSISGSQTVQLNSVKTYIFTLTCQNSSNQTATDSVQVNVGARPPKVITIPAVTTL
jgi:hypothetical protein